MDCKRCWVFVVVLLMGLAIPTALSSQTLGCKMCYPDGSFCLNVADGFGYDSCSIETKWLIVFIDGYATNVPITTCTTGSSCPQIPGD